MNLEAWPVQMTVIIGLSLRRVGFSRMNGITGIDHTGAVKSSHPSDEYPRARSTIPLSTCMSQSPLLPISCARSGPDHFHRMSPNTLNAFRSRPNIPSLHVSRTLIPGTLHLQWARQTDSLLCGYCIDEWMFIIIIILK